MGGHDLEKCPLCLQAAGGRALGPLDQLVEYDCARCGQFQVTDVAISWLQEKQIAGELFKVSAYTRERVISRRPLITIASSVEKVGAIAGAGIDVESIIGQFPKTISDRLDRALGNVQVFSPYPGARFHGRQRTGQA